MHCYSQLNKLYDVAARFKSLACVLPLSHAVWSLVVVLVVCLCVCVFMMVFFSFALKAMLGSVCA